MTNVNNKNKITIIFDFDDTIYKTEPSYMRQVIRSAVKRTKYSIEDLENLAKTNKDTTARGSVLFAALVKEKFNIDVTNEDIDSSFNNVHDNQTKGLGEFISQLTNNDNYEVLVIGGGFLGNAIIPRFVEQFGIKKENIYSGYFKDISEKEMLQSFHPDFRYVNAADYTFQTPYSNNKSELIKLLKHTNRITGNKVIHIGDHINDFEVWQAKECDLFIGFGLNRIIDEVYQNAPVFVKTLDEFKDVINQYSC